MNHRKKRRPFCQILRGILLFLLLCALYSIVAGYLPFARTRDLTEAQSAMVHARVEEMSHDVDSTDRATILETRTEALNERIRLINQAQEEIILTSYDCRDGESTRDILCVLLKKADEGVHVRLLVDGVAGRFFIMGKPVFRAIAAHPNIEVRFYNLFTYVQAWKHMGHMHDKYVIADDLAYILGGRNTFDYFLGEYPAPTHSRDREALVFNAAHGTPAGGGSSLFQVRAYFESVWSGSNTFAWKPHPSVWERNAAYDELNARCERIREEKPELFASADYAADTLQTRGVWLISNPTGIYGKEPTVFAQLTGLMARAEKEIIVHSPYAVLNGYTRGVLTAIAEKVPVTLMINAVENGQNIVASSDYIYHQGEVLSTGMRVLEYAGGDSYHGKSMVIDDEIAIIGSYNLDLRSTYVDTELMLVIRSPEINRLLRGHMEALHRACRIVLPDGSGQTPDGLVIPPASLQKRAALRSLGVILQLVRNIL